MVGAWAMSGRVSTWGAGQAGVVLYMLHMPTTPGNAHTNYTPTPPTFRLGVKGSGRRMLRGKALRMRLRI